LPTGLPVFQDPIDHSTDAAIVSAHVLDALRDHVLSLPAVDGVLSNALISRSDKPNKRPLAIR
jgi:hypothetical protein